MNLIHQACAHFSQDIARVPDMVGLTSFFQGLSDEQLVEVADCLIDCQDSLVPRDCMLLMLLMLRETTLRALPAQPKG